MARISARFSDVIGSPPPPPPPPSPTRRSSDLISAVARGIATHGDDKHTQAVLVEAAGHGADLGPLLRRHRLPPAPPAPPLPYTPLFRSHKRGRPWDRDARRR